MQKKPSLKLNFILNILLTGASSLFPVVTSPYVSRVLLPEGTGQVAFAVSIISYFALVARLGIPTYGIRACAQVREDAEELTRTAQEIFLINALMTAAVYLVFFLSLQLIGAFQQEKLLLLVCSSTMLLNLLGMDWLYKALEQYRGIAMRSLLINFLAILLTFILVRSREDYVLYGGLTVFASVGANLINFVSARKYIRFRPCRPLHLHRHLKPIFVLFLLSIATTIYTHLDVVMLRFLTDNQQVGYYDSAIKVKSLLVLLVTSPGTVLLPRISYYVTVNLYEEFHRLIRQSFRLITLSAVPLCIYFMVMAKESIVFIFGPAYAPSVVPMQIIMPTVLLIGLTNIIGIQMLLPLGKEKLVVISTCVGAVVNLILNALLIPTWHSSGAAVGTLVAEFAVLLVQLWIIRDQILSFVKAIQPFKLGLAALAAWAALLAVHAHAFSNTFITLFVTAVVFFAVYCGVLLVLRYRIRE